METDPTLAQAINQLQRACAEFEPHLDKFHSDLTEVFALLHIPVPSTLGIGELKQYITLNLGR